MVRGLVVRRETAMAVTKEAGQTSRGLVTDCHHGKVTSEVAGSRS